ncbi:hypothetical protein FPSE_10817 [Fusarium pseudograminearum CS3096]|uniref:Uncharacterized protein n=1 Tax=Fusarium pseudograminearum (strain CS3096) TaxID=1028729 RepID=K3V766_FUSPC|nr:hypothetical protein FPSE_10817 [Fusarium pseudograminearum CS3096]EKJ69004.1 hypothetical protein FPSE_10817 [Fusarium pseudograminearum CS3096]
MCTVAQGETVPAWDIVNQGTRVYGGHRAPCRQGTRWSDTRTTFYIKVEKYGASWAVTVTIEGHELATVTDIYVKAMLGNKLVNTGSVAFSGPPG